MSKTLTRAQAVKIIKAKIAEVYGDVPMIRVIKAEEWNELARHYLNATCTQPIPKKMLEFAGIEKVNPPKPPATYRRKEK